MTSKPPHREDIERELEMQFAHADMWDRHDAYEGLATVAGLAAFGWITAQDSVRWRDRFQRLVDGRPGPDPDPAVRERCLELVRTIAEESSDPSAASGLLRLFEQCELITGSDHDIVHRQLYGEAPTPPDVPAHLEVHDVRLVPAARDGIRIVWIARIGNTIRVGYHVQNLETIDRSDAELAVEHHSYRCREVGYSLAATGHASFDAPPPGHTASLRLAGVTFQVDLP